MQGCVRFALALAFGLGAAASARADDAAQLRQELDLLRAKIEQIDTAITDTGRRSAEIKTQSDAYAAKVNANRATGAAIKERGQQLALRLGQLETERAAVEQTCRKTSSTTQEYQAVLAECEKARQAYQQHADDYRTEQQGLAGDDTAYNSAAQALQADYKDIEQKRQDLLAQEASQHQARQETLNRFNEVRDRLTALQPGMK